MLNVRGGTGRARRLWRVAGNQVGQALLMMALSRTSLFSDLSPFSVAWFTAGLSAGRPPWAMLVGCALGSPWEVMGLEAAVALAGCLMVMGIRWTLESTRLLERGPGRHGRLGGEDAVNCALAGLGALTPPLAFALAGGGGAALAAALLNALVAMAFAPVLRGAAGLTLRRSHLLAEEQLSLILCAMLCLMGINASPAYPLAPALAALLTLACGYGGAAQGAAAGVVAGAALALSGDNPMLGASLGLMGLVAGAIYPLGRGWAGLAFLLINLACAAFGPEGQLGTLHPLWALGVAGVYLLLPQEILDRLAGWLRPDQPALPPERLAAHLRQGSEKRLRALAEVFTELAQGYGDCPAGPDEQTLMAQMRRALCSGCPGYAACWNGTDGQAGRMLCQLLGTALGGAPLGEQEEMPPEWGRICRRAAQAPRKLGPLLRSFAARRRILQERRDEGATLGRHFAQAARILEGMGEALAQPPRLDPEAAMAAMAALEQAGLEPQEVVALSGRALEVCATIRDGMWDQGEARQAAQALTRALGAPMRAVLEECWPQHTLRLVQSPRLTATVGYATRPRDQGAPSGDSYLAAGLTGSRVLLALSDGMGSGERAARESSATLRLIRRFLLAQVEDQLMLDAINQLLLLRSGDEMYATADLCVLDLQEGQAHLTKLGACASFLMRRGQAIRVDGGRLPLGILDRVTPAQHSLSLRAGDMMVMITDGIADGASEEQNQWLGGVLEDMLRADPNIAPGLLCDKVLAAAQALPAGPKDDMTVLAARIQRAR